MHTEPSLFDLLMGIIATVIMLAVFCIIVVCVIEAFNRFGALGGVVCLWAFVSILGFSKS